jgi:DNA processing protein
VQGSVTLEDTAYPQLLRQIKDPPRTLNYRGTFEESIFEHCLAVVGSRRMTSYGRRAVQKIVHEIAGVGMTVVSGFMYGIDACAHQAALAVGGRTIAVMPCGIDYIHPENQVTLYNDILNRSGLIISETEGMQKPQVWMYPRRNRIVAGLSKGVLVVEAGLKSGSLITSAYAKKEGRDIFVVPGSIFSGNFQGIHQLMMSGARGVISGSEILEFYGLGPSSGVMYKEHFDQVGLGLQAKDGTNLMERKILDVIGLEPVSIDEISRKVAIPLSLLSAKLTLMVLNGWILEDEGRYYAN